MKKIVYVLCLLSGCTSNHYIPVNIPSMDKPIYDYEKAINDISIGMSKNKVISILGQPLSTEAEINKECLTYPLTISDRQKFVLLFNNGKLVKYNKEQNCLEIFQ